MSAAKMPVWVLPLKRLTARNKKNAVRPVYKTLGQRKLAKVHSPAQFVLAMPCQKINGGFVFLIPSISDCKGNQ